VVLPLVAVLALDVAAVVTLLAFSDVAGGAYSTGLVNGPTNGP
jgi:hypothetical protein